MYCKCITRWKRLEGNKSINSSKVYCKCSFSVNLTVKALCINSSKVYCKSIRKTGMYANQKVLIVAKCIVNFFKRTISDFVNSINSSKVYCKF